MLKVCFVENQPALETCHIIDHVSRAAGVCSYCDTLSVRLGLSRSSVCLIWLTSLDLRDQAMRKELILQPSGLQVAGRWRQLSIKADLGCSEAAHFLRMFAVEHHVFPVRNHGICNVKRPSLHSSNNHSAAFSRN